MTNTNTTTRRLPLNLAAAFAWTQAAGELDVLATLAGDELDAHAADSAANALEHDCDDVFASDLVELANWLRAR